MQEYRGSAVCMADRTGNDGADAIADEGAKMVDQAGRDFLGWCAERHEQYTGLLSQYYFV